MQEPTDIESIGKKDAMTSLYEKILDRHWPIFYPEMYIFEGSTIE
jgi:hypothetical protein